MRNSLFFLLFFASCSKNLIDKNIYSDGKVFTTLNSDKTGIVHRQGFSDFANIEGGGVAVSDFDNDGYMDIFFAGDSLHGLYKNLGNFRFENLFAFSKIPHLKGVTSAVAFDINNDGLPDLILGVRKYSTNFVFALDNNSNEFLDFVSGLRILINKGNFVFEEDEKFMINSPLSISGIGLADFDKNGFVDIVTSTWNENYLNGPLVNTGYLNTVKSSCHVFYNFKTGFDCSCKSIIDSNNILNSNQLSNSIMTSDLNNDGWVDLIITQDMSVDDMYFKNVNGKKFERFYLNTTSFNSMGIDVADINNDGLVDVITTDMRPRDYFRQKTMSYEQNPDWRKVKKDDLKTEQVVKNTLQLNRGDFKFSEISEFLDLDATDWSWSVLAADFDNNGYKDVFFSNGFYNQRLFDKDAALNYPSFNKKNVASQIDQLRSDTISENCFKNYFFKNNGDLKFSNQTDYFLGNFPFSTRGAAYADLDNDGDLDLIFNNCKQSSNILKNNSNELFKKNYLSVKIVGNPADVLHAKCKIFYCNEFQINELNPIRGFYSCSTNIIHFGLDTVRFIDSVLIKLTNGCSIKLVNPKINSLITVDVNKVNCKEENENKTNEDPSTVLPNIHYKHVENIFNDYDIDFFLPQKYSVFGPYYAIGDIDGNGTEDIIIGGSHTNPTTIYFQTKSGLFDIDTTTFYGDKFYEDGPILIHDFNNDGLNDIYISASGNEYDTNNDFFKHRLYIKNKKGYTKTTPSNINNSASVIEVGRLGSKDVLFIGGRHSPRKYPTPPKSYIVLLNQNLKVITNFKPGMVTDAKWFDLDFDGLDELILVGEFMKPTIYSFKNNYLKDVTSLYINEPEHLFGNWNCIEIGDFNNDGLVDFALGNMGENTRYKASSINPLTLFYNDFDGNKIDEHILCYYANKRLYPVKRLDYFKESINGFSKKYYRHSNFASKDIYNLFNSNLLKNSLKLYVNEQKSGLLLSSRNNSNYTFMPLPEQCQFSPIQDFKVLDLDNDKNLDIIACSNFFDYEIERGRNNSSYGEVLIGYGDGNFKLISELNTKINLNGNSRKLGLLNAKGNKYLLYFSNNSPLKIIDLKKLGIL